MNIKLLRDQRKLAEAKLRSMNEDHPLYARYREWVGAIDAQLGDSDKIAKLDTPTKTGASN